jgi:hypothetical protein
VKRWLPDQHYAWLLYCGELNADTRKSLCMRQVCALFGSLACLDCLLGLSRAERCDLNCQCCPTREDCPCRRQEDAPQGRG